jgi:hypothetical protein
VYTIKKTGILALIIVLIMVTHLLGVTNVTGKLLIPTAEGIEPYKCVIVVTPSAIVLECEKKIFQPLNQFDSPKERKIKLNITEIQKVEIQSPAHRIYIITGDSFFMRYRNYYHKATMFRNILGACLRYRQSRRYGCCGRRIKENPWRAIPDFRQKLKGHLLIIPPNPAIADQ